jgi:hypothetical protein
MNDFVAYLEMHLQYFKGRGIKLHPPATEEALIEAETKLNSVNHRFR